MIYYLNQRPQVLGVRNEMTIAKCLRDNKSIVRFGICLEIRCPRVLVSEYVQRNYDNSKYLHSYSSTAFLYWPILCFMCYLLYMSYSACLKMHSWGLIDSHILTSLSGSNKALHKCSGTYMPAFLHTFVIASLDLYSIFYMKPIRVPKGHTYQHACIALFHV